MVIGSIIRFLPSAFSKLGPVPATGINWISLLALPVFGAGLRGLTVGTPVRSTTGDMGGVVADLKGVPARSACGASDPLTSKCATGTVGRIAKPLPVHG